MTLAVTAMTVVGGVYRERCMRPEWQEVFGSAGRAASAISRLGMPVALHTYLDEHSRVPIESRAALEDFSLCATPIEDAVTFQYFHGLETPQIQRPLTQYFPLHVQATNVIRFGMIEGDAVVDAEYAVYDPQNVSSPASFSANGSKAVHLALVLNLYEARILAKLPYGQASELAEKLANSEMAEVVIIKMGALGAYVYEQGNVSVAPAYQTNFVWKIGSGDTFVAHFAFHWMHLKLAALEAAKAASKATAFYCENRYFPSATQLQNYKRAEVMPSARFLNGPKITVYLAGPFFNLAQLWIIEQARANLREMGFQVFSPYHDVGRGKAEDVVHQDLAGIDSCDILFAIGDGLDSGTMYEIGYAHAKLKPIVMYSENETEENKKMMEGSGCMLCDDYVTAIYKTLWLATTL